MRLRTISITGIRRRLSSLAVMTIVIVSTLVTPTAAAEAVGYDSSAWEPRPSLRYPRAGLGVVTVGRDILAIGGFNFPAPGAVREFDVVESRKVSGPGLWHKVAPMRTARDNFAAAVLGGRVYVAGGFGKAGDLADVEVYDPRTGRWTARKPLPQPRNAPGAAMFGGLLYVAGGVVDEQITNTMIVYDPGRNSWRTVAPMRTPRAQMRLVAAGRYLYAIGGRGDGMSFTAVEPYDPRSNSWRTMAPMRERRAAPCVVATTAGDRHVLVVVAGAQFSATGTFVTGLRTTEVYDIATGRWRHIAPLLPVVRASFGCAVDADGAILAIGGGTTVDGGTVFLDDVDALPLVEAA
jgi:N-acetylneuraminic acid mutarotase